MNEFIVSLDEEKYEINALKDEFVTLNGVKHNLEISRLSEHTYQMMLDSKIYHITTSKLDTSKYSFLIDGHYFETMVRTKLEEKAASILKTTDDSIGEIIVKSPMPGLILRINKRTGESIKKGDPIILLEAMKMENELRSPHDGKISEVAVEENISVEKNQILLKIKID